MAVLACYLSFFTTVTCLRIVKDATAFCLSVCCCRQHSRTMSRQTVSRWTVYIGNPEESAFSESAFIPSSSTVYSGDSAKSKACEQRSSTALFILSRPHSLTMNSLQNSKFQTSSPTCENMDTCCAPHVEALYPTRRSVTTSATTTKLDRQSATLSFLSMKDFLCRRSMQTLSLVQISLLAWIS